MFIFRHMAEVCLEVLQEYPCLILCGPRQVGKTTVACGLNEARPREYISLDDEGLRADARRDPKTFLQLHKPPVCIDEVQYAPELFPYIKMMVDSRQQAGDYILTGSQVFELMRGVSESLAGRIAVLNMQGISISELCGAKNQPFVPSLELGGAKNQPFVPSLELGGAKNQPFVPSLELGGAKNQPFVPSLELGGAKNQPFVPSAELKGQRAGLDGLVPVRSMQPIEVLELIFRGTMPAIASGKYSSPQLFYSSYISTYLTRDIRQIASVDEAKFFRFLTATAARTAQILNATEIARDADISLATAQNWLGILETLGIIFYLYPYSNNLLKRTLKKPKMYFYDTGLVCYLARWNSVEAMASGAQAGALFETFAVSEIKKSYFNAGLQPYLYYYRDTDMREIDVLIEQNQTLYPIEIKKTASVERKITKTFSLLEKSGLKQGTGAIICLENHISKINDNLIIVPISKL